MCWLWVRFPGCLQGVGTLIKGQRFALCVCVSTYNSIYIIQYICVCVYIGNTWYFWRVAQASTVEETPPAEAD